MRERASAPVTSALSEPHFAVGRQSQTGDDLGKLALAIAGHSRNPENFPDADVQVDALQRRQGAVVQRRHVRSTSRRCVLQHWPAVPEHLPLTRSSPTIRRARSRVESEPMAKPAGDDRAAAEHRHPVGHAADLLQFVADEHDGAAFGGDLAECPHQVLDSCGVSTAVGSSRIRMVAPRWSVLRILDALLLAHRQLPDGARRVDLQVVALAQLAGL
jgi:hypothetical protein